MTPDKRLVEAKGHCRKTGEAVQGYEIHIGKTTGPDCDNAWLRIGGQNAGAASTCGSIKGCYIHGLFGADGYRRQLLAEFGAARFAADFDAGIEVVLDELANHLEEHCQIDRMLALSSFMDINPNANC